MLLISEEQIIIIIQKVVDNFLIPRFNELGMNATGEWLESLEVVAKDGVSAIRGRDYSEQLAKGRASGKMPPIAPIERWVNAKLGIQGKQANSIAWGIAKKIQKEGTSWYQKGGTDLIELLSEPAIIEFINKEIQQHISVQVEQRLKRQIQEIFN
jgi:hypothetical protein